MTTNNQRKKYKIHTRFYVIIALFLLLLVWGTYSITKLLSPERIQWGSLDTDFEIEAVIIRDEIVVAADDYGRLECLVAEGETVMAGASVATLYLSAYSEDDINNLINIQQDIKDYQTNNILKNIINEDLDYIEEGIQQLITEIAMLARNNQERKIPAKERELKILMEQRRRYMNENLLADTALEKLFLQEEVLLNKIESNKETILAPTDGVVSFFLDGMEGALTFDLAHNMSDNDFKVMMDQLENVYARTNLGENSIVSINQSIYRIVNPNVWYAVMEIPRSSNTLKSGDYCDMSFDGYGQGIISGYVEYIRDAGRSVLIIMKFDVPIGTMATLRTVTGNVGQSREGYKVKIEYITYMYDQFGVVIKKDGQVTFIPVEVLAQDGKYVIVQPYQESQYDFEVGTRLVKYNQ